MVKYDLKTIENPKTDGNELMEIAAQLEENQGLQMGEAVTYGEESSSTGKVPGFIGDWIDVEDDSPNPTVDVLPAPADRTPCDCQECGEQSPTDGKIESFFKKHWGKFAITGLALTVVSIILTLRK